MIAALLPAAAVAVSAPAAPFAPPIDRPLRILVHQERVQAGVTHRYEIERSVVFRHSEAGTIAEMTLLRVWQDGGGDSGRRFEAAAGALKGRVIRFHLSATGVVTGIDDEAALWAATLAGIAAIGLPPGGAGGVAGIARAPAAALAALPLEQRRAALASPLTSIIAIAQSDRIAGSGPVTIDGNPGAGRPLTGTRATVLGADRRLHVTLHAADADPAGPVSLDRERVVDPATGLVMDARETQTMGSGEAAQTIRQQVTISLR